MEISPGESTILAKLGVPGPSPLAWLRVLWARGGAGRRCRGSLWSVVADLIHSLVMLPLVHNHWFPSFSTSLDVASGETLASTFPWSAAGCEVAWDLSLGWWGTCQTDASEGPRPWELCPSLPSIFVFCLPSLAPFLRLSCSPSFPPPSLGPAPALPFLQSLPFLQALPTPSRSGAGFSPRHEEALSRVLAARVPGKACGDPDDCALGWEASLWKELPSGLARPAGPGRTAPAGWASRASPARAGWLDGWPGASPSTPGAGQPRPRWAAVSSWAALLGYSGRVNFPGREQPQEPRATRLWSDLGVSTARVIPRGGVGLCALRRPCNRPGCQATAPRLVVAETDCRKPPGLAFGARGAPQERRLHYLSSKSRESQARPAENGDCVLSASLVSSRDFLPGSRLLWLRAWLGVRTGTATVQLRATREPACLLESPWASSSPRRRCWAPWEIPGSKLWQSGRVGGGPG